MKLVIAVDTSGAMTEDEIEYAVEQLAIMIRENKWYRRLWRKIKGVCMI